MVDKTLFMETLRSVQEIAKASPEPMSREEIQEYFKDMELSSQQQEMIYQFFQKPLEDQSSQSPEGSLAGKAGQSPEESLAGEAGQSPEGSLPGKSMKGTSQSPGSGKNAVHSRHYQMYLNEIHNISDLSREGKSELYQKLLEGDRLAISVISAQWLKKITTIAKAYVTGRALVEDLVQEGNMGLYWGWSNYWEQKSSVRSCLWTVTPWNSSWKLMSGRLWSSTVLKWKERITEKAPFWRKSTWCMKPERCWQRRTERFRPYGN